MMKFLLDKGAEIKEVGIEHPTDGRYMEDMSSVLHRAARRGHQEVVRFLMDHGADTVLKNPMDGREWHCRRRNGGGIVRSICCSNRTLACLRFDPTSHMV